jgi:hypothetical protein
MRPEPSATMVVIEFSAAWPRWLKPTSDGHMAVVAQHYEGHPSSLVTQVASRITRLENVGWKLNTVVVVSNGRTDADAVAARSILTRGLLSRLRQKGKGNLTLTVDESLGKRAAVDLRALGVNLERSLRGAPVGLSVRVGARSWHADEQLADAVIDSRASGPFRVRAS